MVAHAWVVVGENYGLDLFIPEQVPVISIENRQHMEWKKIISNNISDER